MDIIAHRGASGHAPENTLAAFRLAWEEGADGIELDVHLSRDSRVMAHHDADTRRTAGAELTIATSHSRELRALDVGRWKGEAFGGETMPFLEEVLATVPPGGRVLVEIKCGPEIVPALQASLKRLDSRLRLALISLGLDVLVCCREALPQLPCYPVIAAPTDKSVQSLPSAEWIEQARRHGFAGLDPNYRGISADFAGAVRAAGLELLTWTVNDGAEARRLQALGLDAITTDYPAAVRAALAGCNRRERE